MHYVKEFEEDLANNLLQLRINLLFHSYNPKPLETFIVKDPKTRKISKSSFEDRVVHHALVRILESIFDKIFIYDSYANRKGKGTLAALKRFDVFKRKLSKNGKLNEWFNNNKIKGYVLKADIKHYFETISHDILLNILKKRVKCNKTIWLIKKILDNYQEGEVNIGMPLGNLTSQFFANVYLNELDYFVKYELRIKCYIRYVDDFVILSNSKEELFIIKEKINNFLKEKLNIELHQDKSRIIPIGKGIPFLGFRIFYYYKLLKKFNRKNILFGLNKFYKLYLIRLANYDQFYESIQGSFTYIIYANTYLFRKKILRKIEYYFSKEISSIEVNRYLKLLKNNKP